MATQDIKDESIYNPSGTVNTAKAEIHDKSKGWIIAAFISLNLLGTVFMFIEWRDAAMESRLKQYNLDWFKTHEFSDLNGKVQVQDRMILALQVGQVCKKER
jgi:hypothetical protein